MDNSRKAPRTEVEMMAGYEIALYVCLHKMWYTDQQLRCRFAGPCEIRKIRQANYICESTCFLAKFVRKGLFVAQTFWLAANKSGQDCAIVMIGCRAAYIYSIRSAQRWAIPECQGRFIFTHMVNNPLVYIRNPSFSSMIYRRWQHTECDADFISGKDEGKRLY